MAKQLLKNRFIIVILWILQVFIFAGIPALLTYFGLNQLEYIHRNVQIKRISQTIDTEIKLLAQQSDTERFLGKNFGDYIWRKKNQLPEVNFKKFHKTLKGKFDYLIWDNKINLISASVNPQNYKGNWKLAWKSLYKSLRGNDEQQIYSAKERKNLRKIFGPQFLIKEVDSYQPHKTTELIQPDCTGQYPVCWISMNEKRKVVCFVKQSILKEYLGIKLQIQSQNLNEKPFQLGAIIDDQLIIKKPIELTPFIKARMSNLEKVPMFEVKGENGIFFPQKVAENLTIFGYLSHNKLSKKLPISPVSAAIVVLILFTPFYYLTFKGVITGKATKASISLKLAFLFFFSNGLPLSVLGFLGFDYLNQKRYALLDEIHSKTTDFLQNFDERFESEYARRTVQIQSEIDKLKVVIENNNLNPKTFHSFIEKIADKSEIGRSFKVNLIASSTDFIASRHGFFIDGKRQKLKGRLAEERVNKEEVRMFNSIAKFFLNSTNGTPNNSEKATEVELIVEAATQKKLITILQEFLDSLGKISTWGLGQISHPGYMNTIKLF